MPTILSFISHAATQSLIPAAFVFHHESVRNNSGLLPQGSAPRPASGSRVETRRSPFERVLQGDARFPGSSELSGDASIRGSSVYPAGVPGSATAVLEATAPTSPRQMRRLSIPALVRRSPRRMPLRVGRCSSPFLVHLHFNGNVISSRARSITNATAPCRVSSPSRTRNERNRSTCSSSFCSVV